MNSLATNAEALTGRRKKGWSWHQGRKLRHHTDVLGLYYHATKAGPARIQLFIDRICAGSPTAAMRFGFLRALAIGPVLFHEGCLAGRLGPIRDVT